MKVTLDELRTGISQFLEMMIFEILDSTTIEFIEHQIGQCMKMAEIEIYDIRSTILDSSNLKINLQFNKNEIDFFLARGE